MEVGKIFEFWIILLGSLIVIVHETFGQQSPVYFDANFTLQNVWGRLHADSRSIIKCFGDDSYKKIKFSRKLDTGQGTKLPRTSLQFIQGKPVFARILFMPQEGNLSRFGVFQCKITKNNIETKILTLKLPPDNLAELNAVNPYVFANLGDNVTLEVNVSRNHNLTIKWRHDGQEIPSWDNQLSVLLTDVNSTDAGIYECYYEGRRSESVHALMRLIVRNCPKDLYGNSCDKECPPCYNGGICHDTWGVCVCPAGFTGLNCEIACGGNHFGANCSKFCSTSEDNSNKDEMCASQLFCKPDPYGCSCAPGFKGINCIERCKPGWYGADCKQSCHCRYGMSSCNRITGACEGGCGRGWRGDSCQIEDPNSFVAETSTEVQCSQGTYGPRCEEQCHCAGNDNCHIVTGHCESGCKEVWNGASCDECLRGRFGENCEFTCHCEGGPNNCDRNGFCFQGCEAGWAGFTCEQECSSGRFGTNCVKTCHCHGNSTTTCDKKTGVCEGDCEAGYIGVDCQTLCPQDTYGVNCAQKCSCTNGGHCKPMDGSCACVGKYRGHTCNESEPEIVAATNDAEVNTGVAVFIWCKANAVPRPAMNLSSSDFPGARMMVMTFEAPQYRAVVKVTPNVAGEFQFRCEARNEYGYESQLINLLVVDPPTLTAKPVLLDKSNSSLTVKWRKWEYKKDEGGRLNDDVEYLAVYREVTAVNWEKLENWKSSTMATIHDLTPNTMYEVAIKCRRHGNGGEGKIGPSLVARTECGDPLPDSMPQEFLPNKITNSTVSLGWQKPSENLLRCTLRGYILHYIPETLALVPGQSGEEINIEPEIDTAELGDLAPYTTYILNLYPVTALGKSKYPAELTLHTVETVPDPVSQLECQTVVGQPELLLVSWKAPNEVKGVIKGYLITYWVIDKGQCGISGDSEPSSVRQVHSKDIEITLQNLHPYTTYNVSVQSRTSLGASEPVFALATTSESVPEEPPKNVRVVSVTSESLELQWDGIPCESANGIIAHYEYTLVRKEDTKPTYLIRKRRSLDVPLANTHFHIVEDLHVNVTGLKPNEEYGFIVGGVTTIGSGPLSEIIFHKTGEAIPGEPSEICATANGQKTINLRWKRPVEENGEILGYKITYKPIKTLDPIFNTTTFTKVETEVNASTMEIMLEDLHPSTEYSITVQAKTSAGYGLEARLLTWTVILGDHVSPSLNVLVVEAMNETIPISFSTTRSTAVYKYQVIVEESRNSDPIDEAQLADYDTAVVKKGLPYYIAAELDPRNVSKDGEQSFIVGDRKVWGGYKNVHLNPGHEYKIRIRTLVFKDDASS